MRTSSAVSICLWYEGNAEAAARRYASLIPNSQITSMSPMTVTFCVNCAPNYAPTTSSRATAHWSSAQYLRAPA